MKKSTRVSSSRFNPENFKAFVRHEYGERAYKLFVKRFGKSRSYKVAWKALDSVLIGVQPRPVPHFPKTSSPGPIFKLLRRRPRRQAEYVA